MNERPISEDDLHAYVDGALDDARRAAVLAYLDAHPDVAERFRAYALQRAGMRAALDPVAEEPVPTRLNLAHMIERRARRPVVPRRVMAAAAAIFLVVGGAGGWFLHAMLAAPPEGVLALAREATLTYATFASDRVRPVELRSDDMAELVDWASDRMGRKPVVPDLSKSGFRLMGGRVVAGPQGAALMLMYDNDSGIRLVMLSRPMARGSETMTPLSADGDMDSWSWASGGMGYSLVGAMPADALHPLADDIRRQILGQA